jgi:hypothetical protein
MAPATSIEPQAKNHRRVSDIFKKILDNIVGVIMRLAARTASAYSMRWRWRLRIVGKLIEIVAAPF